MGYGERAMTIKKLNYWEYLKSDNAINQFIKQMGCRFSGAGATQL
jgi:hypothetical protein